MKKLLLMLLKQNNQYAHVHIFSGKELRTFYFARFQLHCDETHTRAPRTHTQHIWM